MPKCSAKYPLKHLSFTSCCMLYVGRRQGTDNYFVIFSAVEVDRELHAGNVLVALKKNGKPLGEDGRLKLVSTSRCVSVS